MLRALCALPIAVASAHAHQYLAIDPSAIEAADGLDISLGPVTKDPANPLFGEDSPWEAAWWNAYPTIAYDAAAAKYKMWYNSNTDCSCRRGTAVPCSAADAATPGMCPHLGYANGTTAGQRVFGKTMLHGAITAVMYAESTDGRSWLKPSLGLVPFRGSTANNMVLLNPAIHSGAGVFLDAHEADEGRRFKLFGILSGAAQPAGIVPRSQTGMGNLVSADGIHFGGWESAASMLVSADTANNAVWDPHLGEYIAFSRNWCRSEACNQTVIHTILLTSGLHSSKSANNNRANRRGAPAGRPAPQAPPGAATGPGRSRCCTARPGTKCTPWSPSGPRRGLRASTWRSGLSTPRRTP